MRVDERELMKETLVGLFTEVAMIEHLARTRLEAVSPGGLNSLQFGLVNYFVRNHQGPDTIAGIAFSFQEEEPYTARKVAELEALGMLIVTPPGSQRRDAQVDVTKLGRETLDAHLEAQAPEFLALVSEIPFADLEVTFKTLRNIRLTLDNLPGR